MKQLDNSREFLHFPPPQTSVNSSTFRKACCWYQDIMSCNKDKEPLFFHLFDHKAARSFTIPSLRSVHSHADIISCYPADTTSPHHCLLKMFLAENCHSGADNILGLTHTTVHGPATSCLTLGFFRLEKELSRSREALCWKGWILLLFSHITLHVKQVSLNLGLIHYFATIFFYISPVYRKTSSGISFYIYHLSTGRGTL